ncbi:MAG: hypothetical protein IPJ77_12810 [Planctomycetes bacterium]|nr:hypothetical protein [Planctomycetota bacterium]
MKPIALLVLPFVLGACATSSHSSLANPRVVRAASDAQRSVLVERVKALAGTWEGKADEGVLQNVFSVGSGGSAVREIMFPGTPHEMTNMYHMDGDSLVMTHYCAMGNQPRMRASVGPNPDEIRFEFDGVSNLRAPDEMYMGSMTLTIIDQDHIRETWQHYVKGVKGDPTVFELTRKR